MILNKIAATVASAGGYNGNMAKKPKSLAHVVLGRLNFAFCIASAGRRRHGISLMEVLISIAIMAIGLLSIAALIPVGGIQAQKAEIEQRKADLGLNAFRDFKTRGYGRMPSQSELLICSADPNTNASYQWRTHGGGKYFAADVGITGPPWTGSWANWPVAIDPLMDAAAPSGPGLNFPAFQVSGVSIPWMNRLTLLSVYNSNAQTYFALADAVFRADDDIAIYQPTDTRLPPELYNPDPKVTPTAPPKHESVGLYSWLATITPYYPDQAEGAPAAGMLANLSVAIFYRRSLPNVNDLTTQNPMYIREGMAAVTCSAASGSNDYNSPGGGDVQLTVTRPPNGYAQVLPNPLSFVKAGDWLMLCRFVVDPTKTPSTTYRVFKWYRVVTADLIDETAQTTTQNVTLAGPDWDFAATGNSVVQTYACLFDGIVAVYQRTIRLEGASEWNQ